jgi:hypothetical protein
MGGPSGAEVELRVAPADPDQKAEPAADAPAADSKQQPAPKLVIGSYRRLFRWAAAARSQLAGCGPCVTFFCMAVDRSPASLPARRTPTMQANRLMGACAPLSCSTADKLDYLLMALGTIGGLGSGLMFPVGWLLGVAAGGGGLAWQAHTAAAGCRYD